MVLEIFKGYSQGSTDKVRRYNKEIRDIDSEFIVINTLENPILQEPYGFPSFDVIRFRNVTNGISFGFKAIESSGSSVNSYSGVKNKVAPMIQNNLYDHMTHVK